MTSLKSKLDSINANLSVVEGYVQHVIPGSGSAGQELLKQLKQLREQIESLGESNGTESNVS